MQNRPTQHSGNTKRQRVPGSLVDGSPAVSASTMRAVPRVSSGGREGNGVFLVWGISLVGFYLLLAPLLAGPGTITTSDPLFQAWQNLFPWITFGRWTDWIPVYLWSYTGWFEPATLQGNANLLLLGLGLALVVVFLAARAGRNMHLLPAKKRHALVGIIFAFTLLFTLIMIFAPPHLDCFSQDMLLSWLAGKIVVVYHANPYIQTPNLYVHDQVTVWLSRSASVGTGIPNGPTSLYGPLSVDIGALLSLAGQDQPATMILGFRLFGLVLHLGNALLLWFIVQKRKPELGLTILILYAWNPFFLLLAVAQMHQDLVTIFCLLLSIYLLLEETAILCWLFYLLALLCNPICLLLAPLFLRMVIRQNHFLTFAEKIQCWLYIILLTPIVLILVSLPYWSGWTWQVLGTDLRLIFYPLQAWNSLEAMILMLPFAPPVLALFQPLYWSGVVLVLVVGVLFLAFWLADTIDWLLVFVSWLCLLFFLLQPVFWPWLLLLPIVLVLVAGESKTLLLVIVLFPGLLLSYYYIASESNWQGQAIFTIGVPCLLWGWTLFFQVTQRTIRRNGEEAEEALEQAGRYPRPAWYSRPSWPTRPKRRGRSHHF
jgi:hypothetical protein